MGMDAEITRQVPTAMHFQTTRLNAMTQTVTVMETIKAIVNLTYFLWIQRNGKIRW